MPQDSIYEGGLDLPLTVDVDRSSGAAQCCRSSKTRVAALLAVLGAAALGATLAIHFAIVATPVDAPTQPIAVSIGWLPLKSMPPSTRRASKRAIAHTDARTVDMMASEGSAYFVTLEIGTPPRPFRLHLDTGSSSLFIPAPYQDCPSCDPHFDRAFESEKSTTASVLGCSDPLCGACTASCGNPQGNDPDAQTALWLGAEDTCRSATPATANCSDCLQRDTCKWSGDGVCDDGSLGGTQYCDEGTDSADCDTSDTCCAAHCCSGTSNSCAFQASYGDESGVAGKLVRDMVAIGTGMGRLGAKSYVGVFDKVHAMSNGGLFEESDLDGIFGVAGTVLNEGNMDSTVLDDILLGNGLKNVFGLCLGGLSGRNSAWDVGTIDATKFVGELQRVPFKHDQSDGSFLYYDIDAPGRTTVGSRALSITADDYGKDRMIIVDSGTTLLLLATSAYEQVLNALAAASQHTTYQISEEQRCFQAEVGYDPNDDFPVLSFWLTSDKGQEFSLDLAPQHYLGATTQVDAWCLGIADGGTESIFGDIFMEAFYVSFNREDFTVGFAPVSDACGNHVQNSAASWPVYGCTDNRYLEFDSAASASDMSACRTRAVEGCLDPSYEEFSPGATRDTAPTSCCTCREGAHCSEVSVSCPQQPGGADSCRYAKDGECDEPRYCFAGTDTTDCAGILDRTADHLGDDNTATTPGVD